MIFISDSANSQSLGWLQDLDRDARRSGGDTAFKKTLAAEALPTTQISLEVGNSSEQQDTRNALMAQQSDTVRGAANTLARLQQFLAAQEPATPTTATSDTDADPRSMMAEFTYKNEEGQWVTEQIELKTNFDLPFKGAVTPDDRKEALLSVLNSLVYGVPLSDEAKELIKSEDSFMGLLGLDPDELNYAKENPDYVLDTPLGKMTYGDLEELSKRVYNYVDNPTFTTRLAALETLQDIDERQDELTAQFDQQAPFSEIKAQMQQAAEQRKEVAQEQDIKELHDKEHEADQDFLTNLKFSYDLLRS